MPFLPVGIWSRLASCDVLVSGAIGPLEPWTTFQAHTLREEMKSGRVKEAQVEASGNGEDDEPKMRSG